MYAGFIDKFQFGTAFGKGLTLKMGQTHVQYYTAKLLEHRVTLDDAPEMYRTFRDKQDDCIKVVMRPQ